MPSNRWFPIWLSLILVSCAFALPTKAHAAKSPVHYELSIPNPHRQYVEVVMAVNQARRKTTDLAMPAWTPGSYLVRDFAKHVYDVRAHTKDGTPLTVRRVDKQTWSVENGRKDFEIQYRVWTAELSVRTSYVDERFALLNGANLFLYLPRQMEREHEVQLVLPKGWSSHTAMHEVSKGLYRATDYDELVDSPILVGTPKVVRFEVDGAQLEYVFAAPSGTNADVDRLAADAEQIVLAFSRLMGGLPFRRYVFLAVAEPSGGGGLEHFDSTAMLLRPYAFRDDEGYDRARHLLAHEFFHLWNVKRIHDTKLGPFDYTQENYSDLLWFHEGFTETMEDKALVRAGFIEPKDFVRELGRKWTRHVARPGFDHTPISELSRDAWIKAYKPEPNHRNTVVSYYGKGNLLGVALDLELRHRAAQHGKQGSLEGLFRRLWEGRKKGREDRPITVDDIVAGASEEAGEDMQWFFDRHVYGSVRVPLPEIAKKTGIEVFSHAAWQTRGGKPDPKKKGAAVWTGIVGSQAEIESIDPGSPADDATLMIGDEAVAVNQTRVRTWAQAQEHFGDAAPGDRVTVTVSRRRRLLRFEIELGEHPYPVVEMELPDNPKGAAKKLLGQWLRQSAAHM